MEYFFRLFHSLIYFIFLIHKIMVIMILSSNVKIYAGKWTNMLLCNAHFKKFQLTDCFYNTRFLIGRYSWLSELMPINPFLALLLGYLINFT